MGVSNQRFGGVRSLVVFPGALGDFVCFAAALEWITRRDGGPPAVLLKGALVPLVRALGLATPAAIEGAAGAWLFSSSPPTEADAFFGTFASIECFTGRGVPEVHENLARWVGRGARVHRFRPEGPVHLATHFLACVAGEGIGAPESFWTVPGELVLRGTRLLPEGSNGSAPLIVQPGSGARHKRWSRAGFLQVAGRMRRDGWPIGVVLGPAEGGEAGHWRDEGFAVVEDPPLELLAGLLAGAAGCLGNDSGTSHLAAAVGAPGVAVFGPTDERWWRPVSPRWKAIRPPRWSALDDPPDAESVAAITSALRTRLG